MTPAAIICKRNSLQWRGCHHRGGLRTNVSCDALSSVVSVSKPTIEEMHARIDIIILSGLTKISSILCHGEVSHNQIIIAPKSNGYATI